MELRDQNGLTEQEFLRQYQPGDYERPSVAADMVIFTITDAGEENYRKLPQKELRVLLIQRGGHPFLGKWALPGGFLRKGEAAEQAAARELREETGVAGLYLEQLHTFSAPGRDPRMWVLSCAHMALIDSSKVCLQAGDDAQNAAWFCLSYRLLWEKKELDADGFQLTRRCALTLTGGAESLSAQVERRQTVTQTACTESFSVVESGGLAFDHAKIIACAIERLRLKTESGGIALHLMPPLFTLTQLQQVYEVILDKELLKAAFRRKIAPLVEKTDHFTEKAGHRPSRLYRRNLGGIMQCVTI